MEITFSYMFILTIWGLFGNISAQTTAVNPQSCTYSFVVPQSDLMSTCKSYNTQQLEILQNKVTNLQNQVNSLSLKGGDMNLTHANPTFTCGCSNQTTFGFTFRDCEDVKDLAYGISGTYDITPVKSTGQLLSVQNGMASSQIPNAKENVSHYWITTIHDPIKVFCDLRDEDISWTVIMRRRNMNVSFDRTWADYKNGFGEMESGGDFWLGLDKMYKITSQKFSTYMLWLILIDKDNIPHVASYSRFSIGDGASGYPIYFSQFRGKVMSRLVSGKLFVAKDKNPYDEASSETTSSYHEGYGKCPANGNDQSSSSRSETRGGGWWFTEGTWTYYSNCGNSNLNALTPYWSGLHDIKSVEMKIRVDV